MVDRWYQRPSPHLCPEPGRIPGGRRGAGGTRRVAFRGAGQDRKGLLKLSSGGTVLLEEVAELTPRAQAKLLPVLQDGETRRLGENRTQQLDLRVVAAVNRPLAAEAAEGRSREALLYRLNVVGLTAPPLRERGPDVARLAELCWKGVAEAAGRRATPARETVAALAWPLTRGPETSASCRTCSPTSPSPEPAMARSAPAPCRPPSGRLFPPSGSRRWSRSARISKARWCATLWGGTAAWGALPTS